MSERVRAGSLWGRGWELCCSTSGFLTRHGWVPIAALFLALGGLWAFLEVADEVQEGETRPWDEPIFRAIAGWYSGLGGFWQEAGRDLTALGGTTVITLMVTCVTVFLLLWRHWRSAAFLVVSVVGGLLISLALKRYFDRDRPDLFEHGSETMTQSFPSGHTANSAVAYLAVAILLTKLAGSPRMKAYILTVGFAVPLLVGFSRVALAVHWPTDVVAGWLLGLAWGLLVYAAATLLQKRGAIDQEGETATQGKAPGPTLQAGPGA